MVKKEQRTLDKPDLFSKYNFLLPLLSGKILVRKKKNKIKKVI